MLIETDTKQQESERRDIHTRSVRTRCDRESAIHLAVWQGLALVRHALLAVASDVTHMMVIHQSLENDHDEQVENRPHCQFPKGVEMWEHDAGVAKGSTGAGHVGMLMSARILIVEDEEPLTLLLRYNLEAAGYTVDCAARGDEAELKLRETMPDLVVLDWMLPGISGIEICRRLRAGADQSLGPCAHPRCVRLRAHCC